MSRFKESINFELRRSVLLRSSPSLLALRRCVRMLCRPRLMTGEWLGVVLPYVGVVLPEDMPTGGVSSNGTTAPVSWKSAGLVLAMVSPMTLEPLGMDACTETQREEDLVGERGNMAARLSLSQENWQYLSAKER